MAIQIAAAQAVLTIDDNLAQPGSQVDATQTFLFGHLTRGWDGRDWVEDAIVCTGAVPISGPQSEVDRVELGFVQIARATSFQAFYAGRIASEGGIALNYFVPPALTTTILLDGTSGARDPWYRNPTFGTAAGNRRSATMGDHPGMVVRLSLENRSRSNVRNFLFHCFMDRQFWTILTAIEPGGQPQYIAHFEWRVRYEFKLTWQNGAPMPATNLSLGKLVVNSQTTGRPTAAELQAKLNNPAGERANSVGKRLNAATIAGREPNRLDLKTRFITVPENFWS